MGSEESDKSGATAAGPAGLPESRCPEHGGKQCCKTRVIGLSPKKQLICEEGDERKKACSFKVPFGGGEQPYGYFCRCPVQLRFAEQLQEAIARR